jgi:hypothetical protein
LGEDFAVNAERKFKFQEASYMCITCSEKEAASAPTSEVSTTKCAICDANCNSTDEEVVRLLDGTLIHPKCVKCGKCQETVDIFNDPTAKTLLRTKVAMIKDGTFRCAECDPPVETPQIPHDGPQMKALIACTYTGKGKTSYSEKCVFAVMIKSVDEFELEFIGIGGDWLAKGSSERPAETELVLIVESSSGTGPGKPEKGHVYKVHIQEDAAEGSALVLDGVECKAMVGVPDIEIRTRMRLMAREEDEVPVVEASDALKGCCNLEDLQNKAFCQENGVDISCKEDYLKDDVFTYLFCMTREVFKKQPKWKQDKAKKEHGLF